MSFGTILSSLLAIVISLGFVVVLAWGSLWLLKRFQDGSFGKLTNADSGRTLRFERALPIGPRERLVLVEVDGEQMLLGVTAHAITQLKSWPIEGQGDTAAASASDLADPAATTPRPRESDQSRRFRLRMARDGDS